LLPHDKDYHITHFEPKIDNIENVHHMLVFSCSGTTDPEPLDHTHENPGNTNISGEEYFDTF